MRKLEGREALDVAKIVAVSIEGAIFISIVHLATYLEFVPFVALFPASLFTGLLMGFTMSEFKFRIITGFLAWVMTFIFSLMMLSSPVITRVVENSGPRNAWVLLMLKDVTFRAPFIFVSIIAGVVISGLLKGD